MLQSFVVLGALLVSTAQASDCSPIDLRDEYLGENRNQGAIAWCYAYTTADLLAHRFKIPRVSASDTAITYNRHEIPLAQRALYSVYFSIFDRERLNSEHEYGFMAIALQQAMKRGACYESDFPSQTMTRVTRSGNRTVAMSDAIKDIHNQRQAIDRGDVRSPGDPYAIKNVSSDEFYKILTQEKKNRMFYAFTERACANNRFMDFGNVHVVYRVKNARIFEEIDRVLESGNIVGFDYFSSVLRNIESKNSGLHASSLVGRRKNPETGKCEYLVRNSYGSSCMSYDARLACENGNLWVPMDVLKPRLIDIAYLK